MRPVFAPEQEVRFAVVMYGGVSLAIYINGVAQELFRLVRATAPAHMYSDSDDLTLEDKAFYDDSELDATERVYRTLGQALGLDEPAPSDGRIRTRFVVDIISGTSAGGINGVLLGLALAQQKDFRASSDLWRDVAGIDELLREEKSFAGLPPATPRDSESLLNGYRLYFKAREAMADMSAESPGDPWRPAFVEQLDLAVTTTDLDGIPLPVRLSEARSIDERVHRKVFRFSYGTAATTGETHSDFEHLDLMLGFAARATSSFPFAFEPVLLEDVQRLPPPGEDTGPDPPVPLERFFADDVRRNRDPTKVALADGGYLDNKPFSYATEALRTRRADVPVTRKLVYIEPHPLREGVERQQLTDKRDKPRDRPDVIANIAASISLPRHETIREDVAAVAQRNVAVARLQELGLEAERSLDRVDPLEPLRDRQKPVVDDDDADARLGAVGPAYAAYRTLRVRGVLDELAELGEQLRQPKPGDDAPDAEPDIERQIRNNLRSWIEAQPAGGHRAFLRDFDAAYRQRRLSYLQDRVNDLLRRGGRAARMLAVAQIMGIDDAPAIDDPAAVLAARRDVPLPDGAALALAGESEGLRKLKLALNQAIDGLRRAERARRAQVLENTLEDPERRDSFRALQDAAQALPESCDDFMRKVGAFLAGPLADADRELRAAIHDPDVGVADWVRKLLDVYDDRFEAYDLIVLPLAYPSLGEANPVGIVRISPLDAPAITPKAEKIQEDPPRKLAGIRVAHFGGFLDRAWRDNDLMWGRLDAAEVLVNALAVDPGQRDQLRQRAQAAILRDELGRQDQARASFETYAKAKLQDIGDDERLIELFVAWFKEPDKLPASTVDKLTARSLRISGRVLGDAAYGRKWPALPLRGAGMLGPGIARVARPASRGWRRVTTARRQAAAFVRSHLPFGRRG